MTVGGVEEHVVLREDVIWSFGPELDPVLG